MLSVARTLSNEFNLHVWLNGRFRAQLALPPSIHHQHCTWVRWPARRGIRTAAAFLVQLARIRRYLVRHRITDVLFITLASPLKARLAARILGMRHCRLHQIIHNGQMYSSGQCSLRTLTRYRTSLFLSAELERCFRARHPQLQPARTGHFWATDLSNDVTPLPLPGLPNDVVALGVPGSVSQRRRNYNGLFSTLEPLVATAEHKHLRVYLIGKTPPEIARQIQDRGLSGMVHFWTRFLDFSELFQMVRSMHALALLVDETVEFFSHYGRLKQSGSENLALAFRKPVIASAALPLDPLLDQSAIRYPGAEVGQVLHPIARGEFTVADFDRALEHTPFDHWHQYRLQQQLLLTQRLRDVAREGGP